MTFGTSGATATAGLPGTGLFYTKRLRKSSARPRSRAFRSSETDKEIQRTAWQAEVQDQIEENRKQIEREESQYEALLNLWRDLPSLPTAADIDADLRMQEFASDLQPPLPPDFAEEKQSLMKSIQDGLSSKLPWRIMPKMFAESKAKMLAERQWNSRKAEVECEHKENAKEYESRLGEARAAWRAEENARIEKLQKLVNGDLEAIQESAVAVIRGIPFPFDTWCDLYLDDASEIFVNLDLPEIDDVIPTHKKRALQNGEIGKVRIDEANRNLDYFDLVIGQSIVIAAHLFANFPTVERVATAGYTQRLRRKRLDEIDTYLFEIVFPKVFIQEFDPAVDDLLPVIRSLAPIISLDTNWALQRIQRPTWVREPESLDASGHERQ